MGERERHTAKQVILHLLAKDHLLSIVVSIGQGVLGGGPSYLMTGVSAHSGEVRGCCSSSLCFFLVSFSFVSSCLLVVGDSYPPSTSESSTIMANEFAVAITHLYSFSFVHGENMLLDHYQHIVDHLLWTPSMHHNAQHPPCVLIPCVCARSPAHATLRTHPCACCVSCVLRDTVNILLSPFLHQYKPLCGKTD